MPHDYALRRVAQDYPHLPPRLIRQRLHASTFVNLDRGYLYYAVPKAACTSLKWLIHSLEGLPPIAPFTGGLREVRRDMYVHARSQFKMPSLLDLDDRDQERVLCSPDFLRFTVVRNPYRRVASGWFEKVHLRHPGYEFVYKRAGRDPDADPFPFEDFVEYLSEQDLRTCDHHWRLQSEVSFLKTMNFNLVGRVEQLDEAIAAFMQRAGFPDDLPPQPKNASGSAAHAPMTELLASKIYALYVHDFVAFGYEGNSWHRPARDPDTESLLAEVRERNIVISRLFDELHAPRPEAPPPQYDGIGFDEAFDKYISPIAGWLARDEARLLYDLARSAGRGCIVEVGSYRGRSTATLALGTLAGSRLPVYAIEPHEPFTGISGAQFGPEDRGEFMRTMVRLGLYRQVRLVNLASDHIGAWPLPVSLLWIDGDHRYEAVRRDFESWADKLAPDAAVVFDDAPDHASGPGKLVAELLNSGKFLCHGLVGKTAFLRCAS